MLGHKRSHDLFIGGTFIKSESKQRIDVENPATGDVVATIPEATQADIDHAVEAARRSFSGKWSKTTPRERSAILRNISQLIIERAEELVAIEVEEVGRTSTEISAIDIPESAECFEYYASAIRMARGETIPINGPFFDYVQYEPVGVVAAITPWNFPLNIACWKIAPALAMGNSIVIKPSELTPSTTVELAKIAVKAGLPEGVLNVVTGLGRSVGQSLVEHPEVDMVAFTGSVETGRIVAEVAGRSGKRCETEMGGKSAQVLFADCNIEAAVCMILEGAFFAQGQNCCAGSRLLVEESLKDRVLQSLKQAANKLVIGEPSSPDTHIGCLSSMKQYNRVMGYIRSAENDGATIISYNNNLSAELEGRPFIPPTIVVDPPYTSKSVQEEIFGPVLVVNTFKNEDEAIAMANGTKYDLAAGLWTSDISRVYRIVPQLRAGTVWVNTYNRVFNDAPFGGFHGSGTGRDLGLEALRQYSVAKNTCICYEPGLDSWFQV